MIKKTGCTAHDLVPDYDVLHTLGTEYPVEDRFPLAYSRFGTLTDHGRVYCSSGFFG